MQTLARIVWAIILIWAAISYDLWQPMLGFLFLGLFIWWVVRIIRASNARLAAANARMAEYSMPPLHPMRRAISFGLALGGTIIGCFALYLVFDNPVLTRYNIALVAVAAGAFTWLWAEVFDLEF